MPELPDVERFRRILAEHGTGRRIEGIAVLDEGVLRDITAKRLDTSLAGRRFSVPERVGKWLIARTDGPNVLLHFGMTGQLTWADPGEQRDKYDRVVFELEHGELRYQDMRKLQGLWFAPDEVAVKNALTGQGPDAIAIGRKDFYALLSGSRRALKPILTDQSTIAGLGNILVDEIVWQSRLHPSRPAGDLTSVERRTLYDRVRSVLRTSVREGRVPTRRSWLTGWRDDPDAPCPRCGTPLSRTRVGGRSTIWCRHCQPPP
jgi:formamidopyrimidine-DNA glycosylase